MNQVILEGTAERDAEFRMSKKGNPVASLRLKTDEGEYGVGYHTVVAFEELADQLGNVVEGQSVKVEGRLKTRSFDGRDGNKRTVTEVIISDMKSVPSLRS